MHMKVFYICVNFNLINKALQYIYKKYSLLFTFFFLFSLISNSQTKTPVFTQHDLKVKKVMTKNPIKISKDTLAMKALSIMNEKKITSLCVNSPKQKNKTIGILHIHNLLKGGVN